jgi:hypothetical protein
MRVTKVLVLSGLIGGGTTAEANAALGRYANSLKELDHVVAIRPHLDSYARTLRARAWFRSACNDASF